MCSLKSFKTAVLLSIALFTIVSCSPGRETKYDGEAIERPIEAVWNGNLADVKTAMSDGADVNIKDNMGTTALIKASGNGHLDVVKLLLNNDADVNIQDNEGVTALMLASGKGYIGIVKLLLDMGADANIQNNNGDTALMLASQSGHPSVSI